MPILTKNLFLVSSFMPHGMCYLWKPGLVGLHIISNGIIALAYFSIPITLIYILKQRADIPFNGIFLLFAAFIIFCGTGHAFDIWTLWHPNYWIAGTIKAATAVISLLTAIALIDRIPQILALPSPLQIEAINQQLQQEIEERKQTAAELFREKQFLQAILDNLSDGIVACDQNGTLTLFNRSTQEFHGIPQQAVLANEWANYYDLYLSDGQTLMKTEEIPLFRALSGESVKNVEMKIVPKQGEARTLLANGDLIVAPNGDKLGAVVAMRDISELKKVEQALASLNQKLEERVQERTEQLEKLNTLLISTNLQLEKRNQELDRFAYVTSHDLKAPLRAIANLSTWIEEDLEDKLDDETRYNMNLLRGRVQRLENLINGLLAYSRVGRITIKPERVEVDQLLKEIIDSLQIAPEFTIEVVGKMPVLFTERTPLDQVFSNLIVNAVKHHHLNRGKVTISTIEQEQYYEFTVSDDGAGIDPKYHQKIFTIFQTLEARDTKESTGIGLSIVKKIVENQGGEITINSQLGQGATFRFTWYK